MGVLSGGILGGLQGFGAGAAKVGGTMMQESLIEARERERLAREQALLERRAELLPGGVLGGRGAGTSARAGGAGAAPLDLNDPSLRAQMAVGGATSRETIDAGIALGQGQRPMTQREGVGDSGAPENYNAPRYTAGEEANIRAQTQAAFYRAFGLRDPSHADDLAKAHQTMQGAELARQYATTGDVRSAEGSLVTQGKGVMGAGGTSEITGRAAPGSKAEAEIRTEGARQGLLGAQVKTESTKQSENVAQASAAGAHAKKMSGDEIKEERKRVADRLKDLDQREDNLVKEGKDDVLGDNKAERDRRRAAIDAERTRLHAESDALGKRIGGGPAAAPKATLNALPAGARQIGTSGGKPVYQTPDGKRFIGT